MRRAAVSTLAVLAMLAACHAAGPGAAGLLSPRPPTLGIPLDTARTMASRRALFSHYYLYAPSGPWAIHVLDIPLGGCAAAVALKNDSGAIGRTKTSELLRMLSARETVLAAVNADFFTLASPPGVPLNALIAGGHVITGPSEQPVLAFDDRGRAHITRLGVRGEASVGKARLPIDSWNRASPSGLALFDDRWGRTMDSASGTVEVVIDRQHRVVGMDTLTTGAAIPQSGVVLVAGRNAPPSVRATLLSVAAGAHVNTRVQLTPSKPLEAVGGRPLLLRDSAIVADVDTNGQPGFATGRHPRTAAGVASNGQRLILVVVDGRQLPYSDGMTLRELANLMLALGARDAINLDGGGSTTMVVDQSGAARIVNRPSDREGERPVGDALGIFQRCDPPPPRM